MAQSRRPEQPSASPGPYERTFASRAGHKLESALLTFRLKRRVRGAKCLDIGASTGGFTDCLLQFGAAHVTAIDVGYGQMRPPLRDDPRVTLHEKTNFKTASLNLAAGPFDFVTVDVSHASARSMLRSLAFRAEQGAQGVVLVKPQFELPAELVRRGVVRSKGLRKLAFNRFKKKAHLLGFRVHARADSPVRGAAGNIEILAHIEFCGRPTSPEDLPIQPPVPNLHAVVVKVAGEPEPGEDES